MWPRQYGRRKGARAAVRPSRANRNRGGLVTSTRIEVQVGGKSFIDQHASWISKSSASILRSRRFRALLWSQEDRHGVQTRETSLLRAPPPWLRRVLGRGKRVGVVKRSAVGTGPLRRSPVVHSQPIDLVVFQEPSHLRAGNLVLKRASRLDAFSAYPFPTWLPGDALSRTAGTPEVGPPQSSRTRGDPSQVSCAHGR